ncbi:MAG: transporter [Nocardioidaceae bacterium]|nr:transporter [Nocardioidaceae bacterium]
MRRSHVFTLASVLLVAACLRPAITSVGPLLGTIGHDLGLNAFALGLLGAVPLLMFAGFSPLAGWVGRRLGIEAAVLAALVALVVGMVVRSLGGVAGLWVGTALAAAAVAVANVLAPALVKRDFRRPAIATAAFATTLSAFAATSSGVAVPLAHALGGWREGLLAWVALPLLVIPLWMVRMRLRPGPVVRAEELDPAALRRMWRSPIAWQVTVFFGLQSGGFYTIVTWLPSIEQHVGVGATTAGLHLLLYQVIGSAAGLVIGMQMEGRADQRLAAVAVSLPVVVAMVGLVALPSLVVVWVVLAAFGAGSALTVALSLVVLRTTTTRETATLSGMAQSVGYLIASVGPLGAGALAHALGWNAVIAGVAVVAVVQTVLSLWAGRATVIGESV